MVVEIATDTGKRDICRNCWKPIKQVMWGNARQWLHTEGEGDAFCEGAPTAEPVSDCSCGGTCWHDDPGREPAYHNGQRRIEWDGLIPCGFCNHGGDRTDHVQQQAGGDQDE
jgi:hypothetical protein